MDDPTSITSPNVVGEIEAVQSGIPEHEISVLRKQKRSELECYANQSELDRTIATRSQ